MAAADYRMMTDATGQDLVAALQNIAPLQVAPLVVSIPTGQWSGSGSDYYITVNASNVTANSILVPCYDADSRSRLKGPVWCIPAAGSFTIHTSAIPSGTVTILVQFPGVMGEAQYQVLADVYSKSQAVAKADIVNNLTSTDTDKPLSAAMGKNLNDGLANCITKMGIKHKRFVLTTDSDGDVNIGINITNTIVVGMYPSRTGVDNTRTQWFGLIIGKQSSGNYISVKCVDDAGNLIRSAAVAIDVYWIEGITPYEAT